jgi:transposase
MSKVIGIDVSKETLDVAILSEGGEIEQLNVKNSLAGFKVINKKAGQGSHIIMEATGSYYYKLAFYLYSNGCRVSVENPLKVKRFGQMEFMRAKTDKKDAIMIARYGKMVKPDLWKPAPDVILKVKQKHAAIELLEKHTTALKNQLEAFKQLTLKDKSTVQCINSTLRSIEKRIAKLEAEMNQLIKENYHQTYKLLLSIPGIGKKTAIALITITHNFTKFSNYKQLISYVGLSPRIYQSGTSVKGKGKICKMGMGRIRKLLYMCSWTAKRCNHQCIEFYERLKQKGKPERVMKIAIANKLLRQAFSIVKNETFYEKDFKNNFGF